jgi:hypothetical protein
MIFALKFHCSSTVFIEFCFHLNLRTVDGFPSIVAVKSRAPTNLNPLDKIVSYKTVDIADGNFYGHDKGGIQIQIC